MRIGFDAKRLFCNRTGLGNYSRTIVSNYIKYCPTNSLFLYSPKDKKIEDAKSLKQSSQTASVFNSSFFWRSWRIIKDLKKDNIQIFHGLSNEVPFGIHKSGIKSVVTIHDLIFKVHPKTYPLFDRLIYNLKVWYACKYADKIIAISESTKMDIIKYYKVPESKIEVLYQSALPTYYNLLDSIDLDQIKNDLDLPSNFILSVGTIEKRKNLKNTLRAYSLLEHKIPLIIIGGGKIYKEEILVLIEELSLQKWILFLPRKVSNIELKAIYQLADFTIYPSLYEGFGLPVLESQLCKTPVITSNISSLPEAASKKSLKIDPLNIEAIKTAMKHLIETSNKEDIQQESYSYSMQKFNPEKLSQALNKIYLDLLD